MKFRTKIDEDDLENARKYGVGFGLSGATELVECKQSRDVSLSALFLQLFVERRHRSEGLVFPGEQWWWLTAREARGAQHSLRQ